MKIHKGVSNNSVMPMPISSKTSSLKELMFRKNTEKNLNNLLKKHEFKQ